MSWRLSLVLGTVLRDFEPPEGIANAFPITKCFLNQVSLHFCAAMQRVYDSTNMNPMLEKAG